MGAVRILKCSVFQLSIRFEGRVIRQNFVPIGRTVARLWPFFNFSRWRRPPFLIVKSWNFNCWSYSESQYESASQISCRSLEPFRRYDRLSISQNGGRPPSWIFRSYKLYLSVRYVRPICACMPKFVSISRNYSRWRPSAILQFLATTSSSKLYSHRAFIFMTGR